MLDVYEYVIQLIDVICKFFVFLENDKILILIKGSIIIFEKIEFLLIENILIDNVDEKIKNFNFEIKYLGYCEI